MLEQIDQPQAKRDEAEKQQHGHQVSPDQGKTVHIGEIPGWDRHDQNED